MIQAMSIYNRLWLAVVIAIVVALMGVFIMAALTVLLPALVVATPILTIFKPVIVDQFLSVRASS